mgnify:CR=1 FL=1
MSEHPYVVPDFGVCRECGRGRYLHHGQWKHHSNHAVDCDSPSRRRAPRAAM